MHVQYAYVCSKSYYSISHYQSVKLLFKNIIIISHWWFMVVRMLPFVDSKQDWGQMALHSCANNTEVGSCSCLSTKNIWIAIQSIFLNMRHEMHMKMYHHSLVNLHADRSPFVLFRSVFALLFVQCYCTLLMW